MMEGMLLRTPPTCGLLITSPQGWLLAHATNTPYWDLPKGKAEIGEVPLIAALRECREETGLDFFHLRDQFKHLGGLPYNPEKAKTLVLFALHLPQALDLSVCACTTWVATRGPQPVLEMDDFAWVPPHEVAGRVTPRMSEHLKTRGLLP